LRGLKFKIEIYNEFQELHICFIYFSVCFFMQNNPRRWK